MIHHAPGSVLKRCPGTGRIIGFRFSGHFGVLLLPLAGLIPLLWYLLRVVPKPNRALYPCQRVAAPLASGFIAWIAGIGAFTWLFRFARRSLRDARICAAIVSFMAAGGALLGTALITSGFSFAEESGYLPFPFSAMRKSLGTPQQVPIDETHAALGAGKGIHPGRVVWVHNPDATNENCPNAAGNYWWQDANTNQLTVDYMFSESLRRLTAAPTDSAAWDALFRSFNRKHVRGDSGYRAGEKIAIKVNLCSGYPIMSRNPNATNAYLKGPNDQLTMVDTSPQMIRALLRQLTRAGIAQRDICIGDPMRPFFDQFFTMLIDEFPDVVYLDPWGTKGRTKTVPTETDAVVLSGKRNGRTVSYKLPRQFVEADYTINLSALKGHEGAGITLGAKNHFGTHAFSCVTDCWNQPLLSTFLHYGLPNGSSDFGGESGMGKYRNTVDLMGHKDLDGKGVLFIVDGLWGGHRSTASPNKWKSAPFNNDWPSSIFASQDPVALESVCFDFLRHEYHTDHGYPLDMCYPNTIDGVEDYLHQAADPAFWPEGIVYDPEGDGTPLEGLGVHEHWNNPVEKKYRRNLDPEASGIELIAVSADQIKVRRRSADGGSGFGFFAESRSATGSLRLGMELAQSSRVRVTLHTPTGRKASEVLHRTLMPGLHTVDLTAGAAGIAPGRYIRRMEAGSFSRSISVLLVR